MSFCRFGDGELQLINNQDIPFQTADAELSKRLVRILSSNDSSVGIGILYFLFSSKKNINQITKKFLERNGLYFRNSFLKHLSPGQKYLASEATLAIELYNQMDKKRYFRDVQKIWQGKNLTVICGQGVFSQITYNIFASAGSVEYLYAPALNAFSQYDDILSSALKVKKERMIAIILGPTATVLAYDLAMHGYRALDLGHIAKSYDWFCKEMHTRNPDMAKEFFKPDL